jgi:hypothetical protein
VPAASWFTPAAPILAVPNGPPWGFTACTFAWSYRYAAGELDSPPTARMLDTDMFSSVFINGHNDTSGRSVAAGLLSSGWASADFDFVGPTAHLAFPGGTNNFVLRFSAAGFGGGVYAELYHNGVLVMTSNDAISDASLAGAYFMGDRTGALQIPGETQGFWWSDSVAMDPATMFAELFDGANGMLDLNADPSIDGVSPDNYHMEPGAGGGSAVVAGTADVTGAATGILRNAGTVSGTAGVTGAASGAVRAAAAVSGVAGVTGSATGRLRDSGTVAGVAGVTGAAAGTVRVSAAVAGTASVTGSAAGKLRAAATASGTADVSGAASGALRVAAQVSGTADVTGAATGTVSGSGAIASGIADVTGQAAGRLRATAVVSGTADVTGTASGSLRAGAVVSGTAGVSGAASGTLRAKATASGTADVTGSAEGELSSGVITAEVAGIADVTGQATGTLRVLAVVSGLADVTGTASDLGDTSRHISVSGMWLENIEAGFWQAANVAGIWRENIVQGEWA